MTRISDRQRAEAVDIIDDGVKAVLASLGRSAAAIHL